MIYLSKLTLNPRSRPAQADLRSPYEMHRTLARAFGDVKEEYVAARCLFRVEDAEESRFPIVLAQSRICPDWEHLRDRPDYFASEPLVKPVAPVLTAGQRLAFRLRANPTVSHAGKRLALLEDEEQTAWLRRKGEANGFAIASLLIRPEGPIICRTSDNHQTTFHSVIFDGVLRVTDAECLLAALENGIGAGKGFGFGLLSLARA